MSEPLAQGPLCLLPKGNRQAALRQSRAQGRVRSAPESWAAGRKEPEDRDLHSKFVRPPRPGSCPAAHCSSWTSAHPEEWDCGSGSEAGARGLAGGRGGTSFSSCRLGPSLSAGTLRNPVGKDRIALPPGFVKSSGGSCGGCRVSLCPPRTSLPTFLPPSVSGFRCPRRRRPSGWLSPHPHPRVPGNSYHLSVPEPSRGNCKQDGVAGPWPQDGGAAVPGPQSRELAGPGAVAAGAGRSLGAAERSGAALLQRCL